MTGSRCLLASAATACALLLAAPSVLAASPSQTFRTDGWFQANSTRTTGTSWGTTPVVHWGSTGGTTSGSSTGGTGSGSSTGGSPSGWSWATGPTGSGHSTSTGGGSSSGSSTGGPTGSTPDTSAGTPPAGGGSGNATGEAGQIESWTNATRAQHGMPPLADNALLDHIATLKCQDMLTNNYFGHLSPTYGSPLEMQQAFGVRARIMGAENIAGARDTARAYFMLENSPEHLANILYNGLTDQGAAVVPYGVYGVYVCQEFIGN